MLVVQKHHRDVNKLLLAVLILMKITVKLIIKEVFVFGMQQQILVQLNHVPQPMYQTVLTLMKNVELI